MKALVTGAAGFIGSWLCDGLLQHGHRVIAIDDLSGGWQHNVPAAAQFRRVDITNPTQVADVWADYQPDVVFHFAAYAALGRSHWVRSFNYRNNIIGSMNLINLAIESNIDRFVFASSMGVYGDNPPPYTETQIPNPHDPYAVAKYAVELDLQSAALSHGLKWTIIRPHSVYGPKQNTVDRYRNVVGIFIRQAVTNEPLTIYGDGTQRRAFSYVADIIDPIIRAAWSPHTIGEVYNIGGDQPTTINALADAVQSAMASMWQPGPRVHLPERHEVKEAFCDHTKARTDLGFESVTSLEEGIRRTVSWYLDTGWKQDPQHHVVPPTEITSRLPTYWR